MDGIVGKALRLDGVEHWFSLEPLPVDADNFKDFSISIWFLTKTIIVLLKNRTELAAGRITGAGDSRGQLSLSLIETCTSR